jgi:LacI family transcriptional regulator
MICGSWIDGEAFAAFARGFIDAVAQAGVEPDRSLMVHAYAGESLEDLAANVLSRAARPTAVFCENWRVCQAVLKAADRLGLRIPHDLSVVGYGQNVCEIHDPVPITAFVPETAKVGELAADLLGKLIGDSLSQVEPVMVAGRLVERKSVRSLSTETEQERS